MISREVAGGHFNYRDAGVCIHDGYVLTHKSIADDFYALPGGRAEIMEPSEATIRREMREELGVDVHVERLLWVIENLHTYEGHAGHELGLYYLISLGAQPDNPDIYDTSRVMPCLDAPGLTLQWLPLAELSGIKLLPTVLRQHLTTLTTTTQHILHEDYEAAG